MILHELRLGLAELEASRIKLFVEIANLDAREAAEGPSDGLTERRGNLNRGIERLDSEILTVSEKVVSSEARHARLLELDAKGGHEDKGFMPDFQAARPAAATSATRTQDDGLRTIERHAGAMSAEGSYRLEELIRQDDANGAESRYLAAVGNDDYLSGFGKMLVHPMDAQYRMTPAENKAVYDVTVAMGARAMTEGTGSAGGYAIPFVLDPTILMSGAGTLNPIRRLAKSITLSGSNVWKGVSSDGVTANWYAEAAEVTDDSPTLVQPTVQVRRASAFVPFSIELDEDYAGLTQELGKLLVDAKDVLEAQAFLDGVAASNQPIGILAATGGLPAGSKIETVGSTAFALADSYALKAALPARFQPNASLLANPTTLDVIFRQTGPGSSEPAVMPTRGGAWLDKPAFEWSNLATGVGAGAKTIIYGDIKETYAIADRVGMTVELVPHLFATGANRPSGSRGLFAYWRVGAAVINAAAARFLQIKA